jgi:phage/plasmid-associated DNA primase
MAGGTLPEEFRNIPSALGAARHWMLRKGKQPYDRYGHSKGWQLPSFWMTLPEALEALQNRADEFDGIGFIVAREPIREDKQIIGGDMDCCRDPITGEVSMWAWNWLNKLNSYVEISPSRCGLRWFAYGKLPDGVDKIVGSGPDDLTEDMKAHILEAKPKAQEKLEKGENPFNGFEIYEDGPRHLTVTGEQVDGFPGELQVRKNEILEFATHFIEESKRLKNEALNPSRSQARPRGKPQVNALETLSKLNITDVINCSRFKEEGGQLFGSHPTLGSTTGKNLVVNPSKNVWAYMHDGINRGGGPVEWLAAESGAIRFEDCGRGCLSGNAAAVRRTLEYAVEQGYISKEEASLHPSRDRPGREARELPGEESWIGFYDVTKETDDGKVKFSPSGATEVILNAYSLAMREGFTEIYRYDLDTGIYRPDGELIVNDLLDRAAGDLATIRQKQEVLSKIRTRLMRKPVKFNPNPYLLPVKNGVIDLRKGYIRAYSPNDYIIDRIEITYDPSARCPAFLKFLESSAPRIADRLTLIDWFPAMAVRVPMAYVLFLLGLGRNGKGLYERLLKQFFSRTSIREMPLDEPEKNNFAGGYFIDMRGWIASETNKRRKKTSISTSFLKMTSGAGGIDVDVKYGSRVMYDPYFKTIVDTNTMPIIDDNSIGWQERFIKVDLPYTFLATPNPDNPLEKQRDPHLFDKLISEEELSGILNLLIHRAKAVIETETIYKRPSAEMFAEYIEQSTSAQSFIVQFCEYDPGLFGTQITSSKPIYDAYRTWCDYLVGEKLDNRQFGKWLKAFCQGQNGHHTREDRENVTKYRGLVFHVDRFNTALTGLKSSLGISIAESKLNDAELKLNKNSNRGDLQISIAELAERNQWENIVKLFRNPPSHPENSVEDFTENSEVHSAIAMLRPKFNSADIQPLNSAIDMLQPNSMEIPSHSANSADSALSSGELALPGNARPEEACFDDPLYPPGQQVGFTLDEEAALSWAYGSFGKGTRVTGFMLAERLRAAKGVQISPTRCLSWLAGRGET